MIIVDYSQTVISSLMVNLKEDNTKEITLDYVQKIVEQSLSTYEEKFKDEYGELVVACDSKKKYWRKQFFPLYKLHRKKARENSKYDWNFIFEALSTVKDNLKKSTDFKVLEIDHCEADDIIAVLAECKDEPFLIISGDHDFVQLQKFSNVKQFSSIKNDFVNYGSNIDYILFEHIVKGDRGDGIPNVLSADDVIINNVRQKPIQSKKIKQWQTDSSTMPHDRGFRRNFDRNKKLIDFSEIPEEYKTAIINNYNNYEINMTEDVQC